jgi:surface protein
VHDYGTDGTYTVEVVGNVTTYNSKTNGGAASECAKLVSVDKWEYADFTSMRGAFFYCSNLVSVPAASDGIQDVNDMSSMFGNASSFNGNIGGWDTSSVIDMNMMFFSALDFDRDIGNWNTANVIDMSAMFWNASSFNQDIGGWNTDSVTNMGGMFGIASAFNQDLSGWCVELISSEPPQFDASADDWVLPDSRPDWGVDCTQ